jgi:hypothetical protein
MNDIYVPIPVEQRLPPSAWIGIVLIDGRLPMTAQLRPHFGGGHQWFTLGMAQAQEIPKGVTHWLEPHLLSDENYATLMKHLEK